MPTEREESRIRRRLITLYVVLVVLLGVNMGTTLIPLNGMAIPLRLSLAALMAVLVAVIFMRLITATTLLRVIASMISLWILFLFLFTFADYLTR